MFLKNLDKMMSEKGINKSVLAKESGVPYTTIDGFYKKGWDNVKLSTLLKLAAYFGVSVDTLVTGNEGGAAVVIQTVAAVEEGEKLTDKEKKLLAVYREDKEKKALIDKVVKGEALAPAAEPEKPVEQTPVRKKRRDDFIIF